MGSIHLVVPCHVSLSSKFAIISTYLMSLTLEQDLQSPFGERLYEYQATGLLRAEMIIYAFIGGLVSFSIQE